MKQLLPIAGAEFSLLADLPATREQLDLQETKRIDVWIAHGDRPLQHGRLIEQASFARDLKRDAASAVVFIFEQTEDAPAEILVERVRGVLTGDFKIGLGQRHLDVRDRAVKERPFPIHLAQQPQILAWTRIDEIVERGSDRQPSGQKMAALRPAENPWDRAQIVQTLRPGLALRGTRPNAQELQFFDRSSLNEIIVKTRRPRIAAIGRERLGR